MTNLGWLVATAVMTGCFWIPYAMHRVVYLGLRRHLDNPTPEDDEKRPAWGERAKRAHANAVENIVIYASLALAIEHLGAGTSPIVTWAGAIYFVARLGHYLVYTAGIPVARTLMFQAGFVAQAMLAWVALTHLR